MFHTLEGKPAIEPRYLYYPWSWAASQQHGCLSIYDMDIQCAFQKLYHVQFAILTQCNLFDAPISTTYLIFKAS